MAVEVPAVQLPAGASGQARTEAALAALEREGFRYTEDGEQCEWTLWSIESSAEVSWACAVLAVPAACSPLASPLSTDGSPPCHPFCQTGYTLELMVDEDANACSFFIRSGGTDGGGFTGVLHKGAPRD